VVVRLAARWRGQGWWAETPTAELPATIAPDVYGAVETAEMVRVALLGLPSSHIIFMRCPDTAAPARGPALQQIAARLAELAVANRCGTVVASWEHDPHCDHLAAARIARRACRMTGARLLAYPVWGRILPPGQLIAQRAVRGFRLDIRRHLGCKRAAIMAHRSQYAGLIDDDPGGFQLAAGFIEQFLTGEEVFLETQP